MILSVRIGACMGRSISYHTPCEVSLGFPSGRRQALTYGECQMSTSHTATILRPSISVREIETPDGAALLDIHQGLCLSLNTVGAKIWRLLKLESSVKEIATQLATEFGEPHDRILEDVQDFVADLSRNCLLAAGAENTRATTSKLRSALINCWHTGPHSHPTTGRSLAAKALFALCGFDLLGFGNDFAAIHEFVRNWPTAPGIADPATVDRVCTAVNYACVWYPKRVLCLQRSAVTTCLLRNCSVRARMVMGAQKLPFKAHAWTEVDGRAVNEQTDVQKTFLVWERC